jgi:superkiller protein 3
LGEAYKREGRYVASLKAFIRAAELSNRAPYPLLQIFIIKGKLGMYEDAIRGLDAILCTDDAPKVLASKILLDCLLSHARTLFHQGLYARAAQSIQRLYEVSLALIDQEPNLQSVWKVLGDASFFLGRISAFCHLVKRDTVESLIQAGKNGIGDMTHSLCQVLDVNSDDFRHTSSLVAILSAVSYTHILMCHEGARVKSDTWFDLGLAYSKVMLVSELCENRQKECKTLLVQCVSKALRIQERSTYWNFLGVILTKENPATSQHCFIRSVELDPTVH